MDEDVGHPVQAFFDGDANAGGDFVRFAHGHLGIDFEMQVHVVLQASAAGETFFDSERSGNGQGGVADFGHFRGIGHGIEKLADGAAHNLDGKEKDEETDEQAANMVGGGEADGISERQADGDEGHTGGKQVGDVVPAIGVEGSAGDPFGDTELGDGEEDFDHDRREKGIQGVDRE